MNTPYTVNLFTGHNVPCQYVLPPSPYFGKTVKDAVGSVDLTDERHYHGANPLLAPEDLPEEVSGRHAVKIDDVWYLAS